MSDTQYRGADEPHPDRPCHCEHVDHAPGRWCPNDHTGGATADWVGNVCKQCAEGHLSEYLVWPTTTLESSVVFTLNAERLGQARAHFGQDIAVIELPPCLDLPTEYRVVLPFDEARQVFSDN